MLQALHHLTPLRSGIAAAGQSARHPVTQTLAGLFEALGGGDAAGANREVKRLQSTLCDGLFNTAEQQDAQEFLRMLLGAVHEETNRVKKPSVFKSCNSHMDLGKVLQYHGAWRQDQLLKEDSLVNALLEGELLFNVKCLNCLQDSYGLERFGEMPLNLNREVSMPNFDRRVMVSFEKLVAGYFRQESIDDFRCGKCGQMGETAREHTILKFPRILVVLIKRFIYFPKMQKLSNRVLFASARLDLAPYAFKPHAQPRGPAWPGPAGSGRYRLKAFITHAGDISFGHYVAFCAREDEQRWVMFNDDQTKELDVKSVLSEHCPDAYVLFYQSEDA